MDKLFNDILNDIKIEILMWNLYTFYSSSDLIYQIQIATSQKLEESTVKSGTQF